MSQSCTVTIILYSQATGIPSVGRSWQHCPWSLTQTSPIVNAYRCYTRTHTHTGKLALGLAQGGKDCKDRGRGTCPSLWRSSSDPALQVQLHRRCAVGCTGLHNVTGLDCCNEPVDNNAVSHASSTQSKNGPWIIGHLLMEESLQIANT